MSRHAVGVALSLRLHAAEAAIDTALAETARLAVLLPAARARARLSAVAGQRAFDGTAAAIGALAAARSHLVETHTTLAALARRLGLGDLAVGPLDKPEDDIPIGGAVRPEAASRVNETLARTAELC